METLWNKPNREGISVRDALLKHHETYYIPSLMFLSILGSQSLDDLQNLVERTLSQIHSKGNTTVPMTVWDETPYGPTQLSERIDITPVGDARDLQIIFPVDYVKEDYITSVR